MMRILFGSLMILTLCFPSCATAETKTADIRKCPNTETALSFVPKHLLIVFKEGTETSKIHEIHESLNIEVLKEYFGGEITLIKVPNGSSIEEICQAYYTYCEVKAVNLNYTGGRLLKS